jgi:hypothetical protein
LVINIVVKDLIVLVTEGGKGSLICDDSPTEGDNKYLEGHINSKGKMTKNEGDKTIGENFVSKAVAR